MTAASCMHVSADPVPTKPSRRGSLPKPTFDHAAAVALVADGHLMAEVAKMYGVTRERVRQICKKHGVDSRQGRVTVAKRDKQIAQMRASGVKIDRVAKAFGIHPVLVHIAAKKNGVSFAEVRRAEMAPAINAVRSGESIRSAAKRFGTDATTLSKWAREAEVETSHGPNRDFSHRFDIVSKLIREGANWREINREIGRVEGRSYRPQTVYTWARKNMPELFAEVVPEQHPHHAHDPEAHSSHNEGSGDGGHVRSFEGGV